MKRILSFDALRRRKTTFETDADALVAQIETVVDVEPIIELNKAMRNATDERARWGGEGMGVLAARIPSHIYFSLMRGVDPANEDEIDRRLVRFLADPESAAWRTRTGAL